MYFLWFLSAILLAAPLFAVRWIRRSQERARLNRLHTVIQPPVHEESVSEPAGEPARQMKYISVNEFANILTERSDLIVVDLRTNASLLPFPIPTAVVLSVTPCELDTILEELPADRSVAFCGASNLNIFMIITSPCMEGSAPLYVLEGDLGFAEAA
jgi:hypothetical protein